MYSPPLNLRAPDSNMRGARGRKSKGQSVLATNLRRITNVLSADLLASALGISEPTLEILLRGQDTHTEQQYAAHVAQRLKSAGLPASWLWLESPQMRPEHISALRKLAAGSDNKAPIRRANFRKLVDAFADDLNILADAVEMVPDSLLGVANGQLQLDEQRFGHLNPRLMDAGFKDGWLNEQDAQLTPELIQGLKQLAVDLYERDLTEHEGLIRAREEGTVSKKIVSEVQSAAPSTIANNATEDAEHNVVREVEPSAISAEPERINDEELLMASNETPAAPSVSEPASKHNTAPTGPALPGIPRGALSAGRKVATKAARPAPQPKVERTPQPDVSAVASLSYAPAMPVPPKQGGAAPAQAPASQPAIQSEQQEVVSVGQSGGTGLNYGKIQARTSTPRRGRGSSSGVTPEQSRIRVEALDKLFESARRGAKVTIWRDLVGSSQATWGNIRRGVVLFHDDLARRIEAAMELPEGWLDDPSFPPATLAPWFSDPNVPLPTVKQPAAAKTSAGNKENAPANSSARTAEPVAKPSQAVVTPQETQEFVEAPAAASGVATPQAAPVAAPEPQATAPAPMANQTTSVTGFVWTPSSSPSAQTEPGPIVNALVAVLNNLSKEGRFTESDALSLLNQLMSRQ